MPDESSGLMCLAVTVLIVVGLVKGMWILAFVMAGIIFVVAVVVAVPPGTDKKSVLDEAKEGARRDRKAAYEKELAEYSSEVERARSLGLPIPERNLAFEFTGSDWVRTKQETKLVSCPACERGLSLSAEMCPGCGHPMKDMKRGVATCPTCGSADVEKIPIGYKAGSAMMFGVFSMGTLTKTFKCKKCGYRW